MDFKPLRDYLDKICNVDGLPVCECRVIHKGEVVFDNRVSVKKAMLEENPSLKKFYSENDKIFEVFYLTNVTAKIHSNYDSPEVIC